MLRTYRVHRAGNWTANVITARTLDLRDGTLTFKDEGGVISAIFAPGSWLMVQLLTDEELKREELKREAA